MPPPLPPTATSAEIEQTADRLLMWQHTLEEEVTSTHGLAAEVGKSLLSRGADAVDEKTFISVTISDLARDWDPNRDGTISKMEFRQDIRKLLEGRQINTKDIDELFETIDLDHGGEIDTSELKAALRQLHKAALEANQEKAQAQAKAVVVRGLVAHAHAVAEATKASEQAALEHDAVVKGSTGAQLGAVLLRKGISVAEVASKWGGKSGEVDDLEFRRQVGALLPTVTPEQIDELFDSLDDDGSRTLDNQEVRRALKKMTDESLSFKRTIGASRQMATDLFRAAQVAQDALRASLATLEEQEAAAKKAAMEEKQARAKSVKLEREARESEREMRKEEAAMERQAFKAKVQAKRSFGRSVSTESVGGDLVLWD